MFRLVTFPQHWLQYAADKWPFWRTKLWLRLVLVGQPTLSLGNIISSMRKPLTTTDMLFLVQLTATHTCNQFQFKESRGICPYLEYMASWSTWKKSYKWLWQVEGTEANFLQLLWVGEIWQIFREHGNEQISKVFHCFVTIEKGIFPQWRLL